MGTEVFPKLTYEEFRQLPDDGKYYELIGGEVHLTPAPNTKHQCVVHNLDIALSLYVQKNKLGDVWEAPLDVRLTENTALQPDLVFVSNARAGIIQENWIAGAPDLVVEVLSPSTAATIVPQSCLPMRRRACRSSGSSTLRLKRWRF